MAAILSKTIRKPDLVKSDLLLTIRKPDTSGFRIPTAQKFQGMEEAFARIN